MIVYMSTINNKHPPPLYETMILSITYKGTILLHHKCELNKKKNKLQTTYK